MCLVKAATYDPVFLPRGSCSHLKSLPFFGLCVNSALPVLIPDTAINHNEQKVFSNIVARKGSLCRQSFMFALDVYLKREYHTKESTRLSLTASTVSAPIAH